LLAPRRGEMIVDFCAGAGGKALALGASMRSTGRVYAFDVSARRLGELRPRLARSGLSNVHPQAIASERDPRVKRLSGKIDRVLVDAPCTGLGTLRRNPDLKWRHTEATVVELAAKQRAILDGAATLVRRGGRLLYAIAACWWRRTSTSSASSERNAPFRLDPRALRWRRQDRAPARRTG
jgi:16S rRNA (cytosine967-C5)-methyltransferase